MHFPILAAISFLTLLSTSAAESPFAPRRALPASVAPRSGSGSGSSADTVAKHGRALGSGNHAHRHRVERRGEMWELARARRTAVGASRTVRAKRQDQDTTVQQEAQGADADEPSASRIAQTLTNSAEEPSTAAAAGSEFSANDDDFDDGEDCEDDGDADDSSSGSDGSSDQTGSGGSTSDSGSAGKTGNNSSGGGGGKNSGNKSNNGGGVQGGLINAIATFFDQGGVAGACGTVHSDSQKVVALAQNVYKGGSNCGRSVRVTNTANGQTVDAVVADLCPGCENNQLDLSRGAFSAIGAFDTGVLNIKWAFTS